MRQRVIGLCGYKRSGKSTAAELLAEKGWRIRPMAAPLKAMLLALGLTEEQLFGDEKEIPLDMLAGQTPRHAIMTLGTEWGRNQLGSDIWVRLWAHGVRHDELVVCDDVRFANEADQIRALGGLVVQITRTGTGPSPHPTEQMVFTPDLSIANDGTRGELAVQLQQLANSVLL